MKVEKQADGSEVHVLEKRPWEKEKPCMDCETGKPVPEAAGVLLEIYHLLFDMSEKIFDLAEICEITACEYNHFHERDVSECYECEKLKKWKAEMDYWEDRKKAVQNGTWRAEDEDRKE